MRQTTFELTDYQGLQEVVEMIDSLIADKSRALLFVFNEDFSETRLKSFITNLDNSLPDLLVVGITSHNGEYVHHASDPVHTTLSLLCFDTASFDGILIRDGQSEYRQELIGALDRVKTEGGDKGALLLSSGSGIDPYPYMNWMVKYVPGLTVFGVTAAFTEMSGSHNRSFAFYRGRLHENALIAVLLSGSNLRIRADEQFGWTPIGKKMTVTRVLPGNVVDEIDNRRAVQIYRKYLGLQAGQVRVENVCEFPVFKKMGSRMVPRISVGETETGALLFGAPLSCGDEIRFSYGNPPQILAESEQNAHALVSFEPQALFLIVCMNRVIFLGAEQQRELDSFNEVCKQAVAVFGNSELFMDAQGGGELNSALVYVALREGDAGTEGSMPVKQPVEQEANTDRVPLARRLLTFLNVTTQELEDLRKDLADEVKRKTEEVLRQQEELHRMNREIVMAFSNAVNAKDNYTNGHSQRVAAYAREIARRYGYDEARQEMVYMVGLMHDVGKIGIPDEIIHKTSRLSDQEYHVIRQHPSIGAKILDEIVDFPEISYGAHWHHERYDGKGYPDGLSGENIPEIAQIISVADAYDAMTSTRTYHSVMEQQHAREEIQRGRGMQFSPRFADIMLEMIDEDIDYTMRG